MFKSGKGFTLIELLVVIAIIAILAAILFPIFAQVKDAGRKAVCQNNVKMMLSACMLYENDESRILPGALQGWDMRGFWVTGIDKYLKQLRKNSSAADANADIRGVFKCPACTKVANLSEDMYRTYGYNYWYLGGDPNTVGGGKTWPLSTIVRPTKTIRILEGWNYRDSKGTMMCYPPSVVNVCLQNYVWPPGWHSGLSAVGWFDGHVSMAKFAPPSKTTTPDAYTGIMAKGPTDGADPYFRRDFPKP